MMEAVGSSETTVNVFKFTRRHIPDDKVLHSYIRENLKSHNINETEQGVCAKKTRIHTAVVLKILK
jgi:hypothetical protein